MLEELLAGEGLEVRVVDPALAYLFIGRGDDGCRGSRQVVSTGVLCRNASSSICLTRKSATSAREMNPHVQRRGSTNARYAFTCCLPRSKQRRHPGIGFRGSLAGLCPPLPTLRRRPYGRQRTARGRCGSLLLHRSGLAPPTPCRSPGALRILHAQPASSVTGQVLVENRA